MPILTAHAISRPIAGNPAPKKSASIALPFRLATILFLLLLADLDLKCLAQSTNSQTNSGTSKSFIVNSSSSYSVNTSASGSPGVSATAVGNLILSPTSSLITGIECTPTSCSSQFTNSNSEQSILVTGTRSIQNLIIDPASEFRTKVDTSTATQTTNLNTGSASSGLSSNSTLQVTEQTSQFQNVITTVY